MLFQTTPSELCDESASVLLDFQTAFNQLFGQLQPFGQIEILRLMLSRRNAHGQQCYQQIKTLTDFSDTDLKHWLLLALTEMTAQTYGVSR